MTLDEYLTSSYKYNNRLSSPALTPVVRATAVVFVDKINKFFTELGVSQLKVSSGFRPPEVNKALPNSAKKSAHMSGKAVDFEDVDGSIKKLVASRPDLLRKYGLMMEDPSVTKTWCHLDMVERSDRPSRIFKP